MPHPLQPPRSGSAPVWVCAHPHGGPHPDPPLLEACTLLSAVAAVTQNVKLGTLVTPPFFRNPAVLAKQIATLDHISDGRATPGFGAGWFEPEFTQYGLPFPKLGDRLAALEEAVEIMKRRWTEEKVTFEDSHFQVRDVMCGPKPAPPPPVLSGGGGDGWGSNGGAGHAPPCKTGGTGTVPVRGSRGSNRRKAAW